MLVSQEVGIGLRDPDFQHFLQVLYARNDEFGHATTPIRVRSCRYPLYCRSSVLLACHRFVSFPLVRLENVHSTLDLSFVFYLCYASSRKGTRGSPPALGMLRFHPRTSRAKIYPSVPPMTFFRW